MALFISRVARHTAGLTKTFQSNLVTKAARGIATTPQALDDAAAFCDDEHGVIAPASRRLTSSALRESGRGALDPLNFLMAPSSYSELLDMDLSRRARKKGVAAEITHFGSAGSSPKELNQQARFAVQRSDSVVVGGAFNSLPECFVYHDDEAIKAYMETKPEDAEKWLARIALTVNAIKLGVPIFAASEGAVIPNFVAGGLLVEANQVPIAKSHPVVPKPRKTQHTGNNHNIYIPRPANEVHGWLHGAAVDTGSLQLKKGVVKVLTPSVHFWAPSMPLGEDFVSLADASDGSVALYSDLSGRVVAMLDSLEANPFTQPCAKGGGKDNRAGKDIHNAVLDRVIDVADKPPVILSDTSVTLCSWCESLFASDVPIGKVR